MSTAGRHHVPGWRCHLPFMSCWCTQRAHPGEFMFEAWSGGRIQHGCSHPAAWQRGLQAFPSDGICPEISAPFSHTRALKSLQARRTWEYQVTGGQADSSSSRNPMALGWANLLHWQERKTSCMQGHSTKGTRLLLCLELINIPQASLST